LNSKIIYPHSQTTAWAPNYEPESNVDEPYLENVCLEMTFLTQNDFVLQDNSHTLNENIGTATRLKKARSNWTQKSRCWQKTKQTSTWPTT